MQESPLHPLPLRWGSAPVPPKSSWRAAAQAVTTPWQIDAAFFAHNGGRSILSNCSRLWASGSSAPPSGGGAPLSTVGRVMKDFGLGRLRNLDPKTPVQRYQWEKPGDLLHVDTRH